MDPTLHKAVTQGDLGLLKCILTADPKSLLSKTPQQNTALHIAARLGHRDIVGIMLGESETLLLEKSLDGDTPLHVASKFGKIEVVDLLINYFVKWPIEEEGPLTTTNKLGNTALHEAVTHGKQEVALRLLEANPNVGRMLNEKQESPLHFAAREGLKMVVEEILRQPWVEQEKETQPAVSGTGSPLHQAVLGGHIKIVEWLLDQRSDLMKQVDSDGNNALHYAAQNNNEKMAVMLIEKEPSLAYDNNNWGQSPLHMAVYYGSLSAVETILKICPDTAEQFDPDGGNALHIAVGRGVLSSLKCLLKNIKQEGLINHRDYDGNTPLHLAAKLSRRQMSMLLARDKRVNPCVLNNKGQTARSAIEMLHETSDYDLFVWNELKKLEAKRCKKHYIPPPRADMQYKKNNQTEGMFNVSIQTYSVIAALITTVTFAATFTMPGGYDQQTGYAILRNEAAFKIFVMLNTIAMCSALVVMVCFMWAWQDLMKFKLIQMKRFHRLTILALFSLLGSLITAVYLVVELKWLVSIVIFIGLSAPVMVCAILGIEVLSL